MCKVHKDGCATGFAILSGTKCSRRIFALSILLSKYSVRKSFDIRLFRMTCLRTSHNTSTGSRRNVIKLRKLGNTQTLASLYEGGAPKGRVRPQAPCKRATARRAALSESRRECPVKQGTIPQSASLIAPSKRGPRYNCYIS